MNISKLAVGIVAYGITGWTLAGTTILGATLGNPLGVVLGFSTNLPILEGGILTVALVGLVAGIRIVQRKRNSKD